MKLSRKMLALLFALAIPCRHALGDEEIPRYVRSYLALFGGEFYDSVELHRDKLSEQSVLSFCKYEMSRGEYSHKDCQSVLFVTEDGRVMTSNSIRLWQGKVISFSEGRLRVEQIGYAKGDPECCPSVDRYVNFSTKNGKIEVMK